MDLSCPIRKQTMLPKCPLADVFFLPIGRIYAPVATIYTRLFQLVAVPTILLWLFIAVFSAVGNAGVPMGCYFLTLSLMAGTGAPVDIMGIILPIFTIIDMVEYCI